jgi:hypothetical protein
MHPPVGNQADPTIAHPEDPRTLLSYADSRHHCCHSRMSIIPPLKSESLLSFSQVNKRISGGHRRLPPIHLNFTCIGEGGTCLVLTFLVPLRSTKLSSPRPIKLKREAKCRAVIPEALPSA